MKAPILSSNCALCRLVQVRRVHIKATYLVLSGKGALEFVCNFFPHLTELRLDARFFLDPRVAEVEGAALPERSGSSTKGRTSNIRYFVAKPSIVAIHALFEKLSTKAILLS